MPLIRKCPTPNLDVRAKNLTVLWQNLFYEVLTNYSLHKIHFAIKWSKFELKHPNFGWDIFSCGGINNPKIKKYDINFQNLFLIEKLKTL